MRKALHKWNKKSKFDMPMQLIINWWYTFDFHHLILSSSEGVLSSLLEWTNLYWTNKQKSYWNLQKKNALIKICGEKGATWVEVQAFFICHKAKEDNVVLLSKQKKIIRKVLKQHKQKNYQPLLINLYV
jgi:hypothetical protein